MIKPISLLRSVVLASAVLCLSSLSTPASGQTVPSTQAAGSRGHNQTPTTVLYGDGHVAWPTTSPATSQAATTTAPAALGEATTPKGALRLLVKALEQGDGPTVRALLLTQDDKEQRVVDAVVEMAKAVSHLKQAALKAWGPEGARPLIGGGESSQASQAIESAQVQTQRNIAVVQMPGQPPIYLQQTEGRWQVPLVLVTPDITPDNIEQRTQEIRHQARLYEQTAAEIASGRHKDATAAAEALRTQIQKLTGSASHPATMPSTTQVTTAPTTASTTQPAPGS